jgi:putative ABC transport system permease protein
VSIDEASRQIETIAAQLAESFPETNRGTLQEPNAPRAVTLVPANEAMVDPADRGVLVSVASLLMVGALLVLLIACANLASLELARGARRVHEVALRFSLGASKGRVVIPLLIQSGLLALVGGAAGMLLAHAFTPLILPATFVTNWIAIDAAPGGLLDFRLFGFAFVLSLAAGTLCALAPALQASRTEPGAMLKSGASRAATGRGAFGARNFLVVGQVALALLLLIGAGLLAATLRNILAVDAGYTLERALIAAVDLPSEDYSESAGLAFLDALKERLEAHPQVTAVTYARSVPVSPLGQRRLVLVDGYAPQPGEDMEINFNVVGDGFFDTLGIALRSGREFLGTDRASSAAVAVVNETFVRRFLAGGDAVGKTLRFRSANGSPIEIVGVVRDGKYRSLRETPLPYLYLPLAQNYSPELSIVIGATTDPIDLAPVLRSEVRLLDPRVPLFGVRTLEQHRDTLITTERTVSRLIVAFGSLAVLLVTLGIYALMAFLVAQRTREFGTRLALGAPPGSVLRLVLGRGVVLTLVGLALGVVAALALMRALSGNLYGVSATEPAVFVLGALALLATTTIAAYFPARRATKVDPMVALREE